MKILIFYAKYGGGHFSAACSIKSCINEIYQNVDVEMIDFMEYSSKELNKITTKAYSEMAKKAPKTWGHLYWKSKKGPLAHISTTSNKILSLKLNKLLQEKKPDIIISTHPFSSQICGYLAKHHKIHSKIATIITDFASHNQWLVYNDYIDYFFIANTEMKIDLLKKDIPEHKIFVTGIPISSKFLLNYNKNDILKEFNLKPKKQNILFFGGGEFGLGKNFTLNVFKEFVNYSNNIQIIAISGKNKKMKDAFENIVLESNKKNNVRILEYTDKVAELMSISDLVVTKPGGLTSSESLASELPMIIINPIPGQEEENAQYLVKKEVAIWIKKDDDIKNIISKLLSDSTKLSNMKQNIKLISKPNSTYNICKILLEDTL